MTKGKNLVSFFIPALIISVALFSVIAMAIYYVGVKQPLDKQAQELIGSQLRERSQLVNQKIEQLQNIVRILAEQNLDARNEKITTDVTSASELISDSKIFTEADLNISIKTNPVITHTTVELLRRGLQGEVITPEIIIYQGKPQYVAFVHPIGKAKTDEALKGSTDTRYPKVLLATVNTNTLSKMVGLSPEGSSIAILQNFSGGRHIIPSLGTTSDQFAGGPLLESARFGANWSLGLWQQQSFINSIGLLPILLAIAALLALLIACLMPYFSLYRIMSDDARSFIQAVSANKMGNNFKLVFFNELGASYRRVADDGLVDELIDDSASVVEQQTPTKKVKPEARMQVDLLEVGQTISADIFREYDIRGIAGQTLKDSVIFALGKAVGSEAYARGEQKIIVARDGRLSSESFHKALIQGLLASGRDVIDLGMVPTPVLYFATQELDTNSGVMLTGSHNPADHNGLKIVIANETLYGRDIQAIYKRIKDNDLLSGKGQLRELDMSLTYLEKVVGNIELSRPLKVAVDCGNGVTGEIAPRLLQALGCDVIGLYTDIDGNFPNHHPDPNNPDNLTDLIAMVKSENADVGIAFDGDGDRLGVVDNKGKVIWTDRVLMLLAMDILSRNLGADILYDVKCSPKLGQVIRDSNGIPVMWKTGHSLMKAKMQESGAVLGGEGSGHIYIKERWNGFDDGMYAAARLLELIAKDSRQISEVFELIPDSSEVVEVNLPVPDKVKFKLVKALEEKGNFEGAKVSTIDGVRAEYDNGWLLTRASNTSANLVIKFEADDKVVLERLKNILRLQLKQIAPKLKINF